MYLPAWTGMRMQAICFAQGLSGKQDGLHTSDETDGVAIAVQQAPVHLKK
jgi:hypothetical protein